MSTVSFDLTATYNERFARRPIGQRYYAGLAATGFEERVVSLAPGQSSAITASPTGAYASLLVAADPNTTIVVGWVDGAVTTELAINQLALVTPPAGTEPYVRNTAGDGSVSVPVKILATY